jgi:hypothetical protein
MINRDPPDMTQGNVWDFLKKNPTVLKMRDCSVLYNYFGIVSPHRKNVMRAHKSNYKKYLKKGKQIKRKAKGVQSERDKLLALPMRDLMQLFKEFVGYVDENGIIREGKAFPPPIDEKGQYLGILKHELRAFRKAWRWIKSGYMIKWPRGYGKTYIFTWFIEFTLEKLGWPWLYLSSTAILSDVAYWIYKWALRNDLIRKAIKGGKHNTYTQFELKSGGLLRIFEYLGEELVGQHGWYIAMDDIVKKKWENKPTDNAKAKRQWNFSINFIKRMGLLIAGTRKYQGDPLEYLEASLKIKGMKIDTKTPYMMDGRFPDWVPIMDEVTGREKLWVPELYTWEELEDKKYYNEDPDVDPYLAFQAEMMQNPLPRVGGLCENEDLRFVQGKPHFVDDYIQLIGIGVDIAWTEGELSDNTGIVSCTMGSVKLDNEIVDKLFTFLKADIGRMPVRNRIDRDTGEILKYGILEVIQMHFVFLRKYYPGIHVIIAIERNAGGIMLIDQARRESDIFTFADYIIEDSSPAYRNKRHKNSNTPIRLGITHSKEKVARIFGELQHSIKSHQTVFLQSLWGGPFIEEIVTFPKARYDDGVDAGGMIKDELSRRYSRVDINELERMTKQLKEFREAKFKATNVNAMNLKEMVEYKYNRKKRSMF